MLIFAWVYYYTKNMAILSLNYSGYMKIILLIVSLFTFGSLSAQTDSALVLIKEVKAQLNKGANFCEMARIYSEDSQTKSNCGEIGVFGRGELMRGYEDAMVKMKIGEISEIVKTGYGYHIIQLVSIEKKKYGTRHILIRFR
jgi:hypothetical protein